MYEQVYTRGLRAYVPMHEGSNCCGKCLGNQAASMSYDWKTCLALDGALKARSEERSLVNAKWAWSEVRIGLGDTFGLVGRLRHRNRRRPRRGRRAVHQGQRRPPPGRREVRKTRTGTRLSGPHPKAASGRGLFCAGGGEAARARNRRQAGPPYRPRRSLGRGGPKHCAPRVWQCMRAAPCAASPSARAGPLMCARRPGRLAWARGWGGAARGPHA